MRHDAWEALFVLLSRRYDYTYDLRSQPHMHHDRNAACAQLVLTQQCLAAEIPVGASVKRWHGHTALKSCAWARQLRRLFFYIYVIINIFLKI